MSARPVVGIVASGHRVPRHWGELAVFGTPTSYLDGLVSAGARPVVLAGPLAAEQLDLVDAVVLTGGGDVAPSLYAGSGETRDVDPERDDADLAVARRAAELDLPLLGVCRGLQILAVAFGGTLRTDLGAAHVRPEDGHRILAEPGSEVARRLGEHPLVSSLHQHAVDDPGPCWRVSARAEDDCIEAIEWAGPGDWPVLGVQWHPELDSTGPAVFGWLVARAERRHGRQSAFARSRRG